MDTLILSQKDLDYITELLKRMPFEHAYPLFIFLKAKVEEGVRAQQVQETAQSQAEVKKD